MSALPGEVEVKVQDYLAVMDQAIPGVIKDFLVVGSIAAGAYCPNRSDIDFVALIDDPLTDAQRHAIDGAQHELCRREQRRALLRLTYPLVCNGLYLLRGDVTRPWGEVRTQADHTAPAFASGSEVFPITYKELEAPIVVRGSAPTQVYADDIALREWNRQNLDTYWRSWQQAARGGPARLFGSVVTYQALEWGPLSTPRLHFTIETGQLCSKEQAGEWAKDVYEARWHPTIDRALAYRRGKGLPLGYHPWALQRSADFVAMVLSEVGL